jgi:hypothetical protein
MGGFGRMLVQHAARGQADRTRDQQADAGQLQLGRPLPAQQQRTQRCAGHAAQAEAAVQIAHDGPAGQRLERRALGVDRDIEQAHGGAQQQHRRQHPAQRGPLQRQRQHGAHQQRRQHRGASHAQAGNHAPGTQQRQHGAKRHGQQHQRQGRFAESVMGLDARDMHAPDAADQSERGKLGPDRPERGCERLGSRGSLGRRGRAGGG